MKFSQLLMLVPLLGAFSASAAAAGEQTVQAADDQLTALSAEHFTGKAWAGKAFRQQSPAVLYGAYVRFEPGARTHWHSHPLGQTLIVTEGKGYIAEKGGKVRLIKAGDVVVCPPGLVHWHGAAKDSAMAHVAVAERHPSQSVTWLEPVSDADYTFDSERD